MPDANSPTVTVAVRETTVDGTSLPTKRVVRSRMATKPAPVRATSAAALKPSALGRITISTPMKPTVSARARRQPTDSIRSSTASRTMSKGEAITIAVMLASGSSPNAQMKVSAHSASTQARASTSGLSPSGSLRQSPMNTTSAKLATTAKMVRSASAWPTGKTSRASFIRASLQQKSVIAASMAMIPRRFWAAVAKAGPVGLRAPYARPISAKRQGVAADRRFRRRSGKGRRARDRRRSGRWWRDPPGSRRSRWRI